MIPTVLISIRREHNKEIFARRKRFEGRKTVPVSLKAYDRRLKPPQSWRYLKTP